MRELAYPIDPDTKYSIANLELTTKFDCLESYKRFTCRYNFPYCDLETGEVHNICQEECKVFYFTCGMDTLNCDLKNVSIKILIKLVGKNERRLRILRVC